MLEDMGNLALKSPGMSPGRTDRLIQEVKAWLKKHHYKQKDLANDILHMTPQQLNDILTGDTQPTGEQACRLRTHADTLEWLAFRLTMLGCEFEVHQPPELAEYLRALSARAARAAGAP